MGQIPIPNHWKISPLEEVVRIKQGAVVSASALKTEGFPVYGANGRIGFWDVYHYEEPQVLVTCRGSTCGTINFSESKSFITNNSMALLPISSEEVYWEYLGFCLKNTDLSNCITGTGQPQITKGLLGRVIVPIPPLTEQRAISRALRAVQEAKETRRRELALERERKAALMQYLFTHGTRGETQKQTDIGEMPKSWRVVRLGEYDCCRVRTSFPPFNKIPQLDTQKDADELVLALKVSDMNLPSNTKFLTTSQISFHHSRMKDLKSLLRPGSIVFPKRGAAIATNKKRLTHQYSILDPNLIAIETSDDINHEYLFGFFQRFDLKSLQDNNPIPQLNKNDVERILLPIPSLAEQDEIAETLRACDEKINALEKESSLLEELFKATLEELMTGQLSAVPLIETEPLEVETSTAHTS
jgi:type I restriction enzyme S subunit